MERSWCKWADRFSIPHDEVLNFIHGKQAITSLRHFLPGRSEEEIQSEFVWLEKVEAADTDGVTALPGAVALLRTLDDAGIPWAIVTSGAELLGLAPGDCAVVEDAPAGLLSGLNAGCRTIAVNVPADAPRLDEADLVLTTLENLLVERLPDGNVNVSLKD